MKVGAVINRIEVLGGYFVRQRGSHRFFRAEGNGVTGQTTVSGKLSDQITKGLLAKIERDLSEVFGDGWLT